MFQRMFQGRYGNDKLNHFLMIVALILAFASVFVSRDLIWLGNTLSLLGTLLIAICLLRMFSRNFSARMKELSAFNRVAIPVSGFFWSFRRKQAKAFEERRLYKHFRCPQCMQKLRVPRGKGNIRITCAKCGNKFMRKT